ncbi:hypothetical protein L1987_42786 [Smallanthus sonchifolius]|uniref:Uncharacterized protein n=1 Tax=Smallanthus sonchifolius TaxID=185202 RepID=A0ACB9GKT2_9ASTR|nr:hypothetical protein L1987_42786 [Smallanthus sonchifolius]
MRLLTRIFRDVGQRHCGELGTTVRELRLVLSLPLFTTIQGDILFILSLHPILFSLRYRVSSSPQKEAIPQIGFQHHRRKRRLTEVHQEKREQASDGED